MKNQVVLCFLIICYLGGVAPRVMQDRFWVESRSPIVSQRHRHHLRDLWAPANPQPLIDRKIHAAPQKMTEYDENMRSSVKASSSDRHSSFSTLRNSFRRGKGLISPKAIFPEEVEDVSASSEEMQQQQCDSSRVRVCEHCLKITRRPYAYENCCSNRNNSFGWCEKIYNFTNRRNRGWEKPSQSRSLLSSQIDKLWIVIHHKHELCISPKKYFQPTEDDHQCLFVYMIRKEYFCPQTPRILRIFVPKIGQKKCMKNALL